MYIPSKFREDGAAALHQLMEAGGLCNFITATPEGLIGTPLPMFLDPNEGEFGTLYGHLARANPQWQLQPAGESLAIFMGPDAYVTPSWYEAKQADGKVVPTWNYFAVHVYGQADFFDDNERLMGVITRLTDLHEGPLASPWAVSDAPADFIQSLLRGIVGLRMPISRIDAQKKMSQNRCPKDRENVAKGLCESDQETARAAGKMMGDCAKT